MLIREINSQFLSLFSWFVKEFWVISFWHCQVLSEIIIWVNVTLEQKQWWVGSAWFLHEQSLKNFRLYNVYRKTSYFVYNGCWLIVNSKYKLVHFFLLSWRYHLKDVIVGKIYFLLVRIKIRYMELAIVRRETTGAGKQKSVIDFDVVICV